MDEEWRLLAGARQLDQAILAEIYDAYSPEIFRYAWRLLGNADMAEECVADIFSRFIKTLNNGNGPRKYLRAYLYRIAHNWIHDYWLKCKNNIESPELDKLVMKEFTLEENISNQQDLINVHAALKKLTTEQQAVIILKFLDEKDNVEIAKIINKPVGAVKALQHRGLNSLRKLLSRQHGISGSDDPNTRIQLASSVSCERIL